MKKSLIPRHLFREGLTKQAPGLLESWLDRWGFTNDGVVLIGTETYCGGPVLSLNTYEKRRLGIAPSNGHTLMHNLLRVLVDGSLLSNEMVEIWCYNKEL